MNDDLDLDSVLFGGSDPPNDGSFDPFLPGLRQEGDTDGPDDGTSDGYLGDGSEAAEHDDADNIVGYGRFSDEGYRIHQQNDDGPLPWQREGDIGLLGAEERRAREGADTGTRNIRGVAEKRAGSVGAGEAGTGVRTNQPNVDSSISAAAERIRADIRVPLDARERSSAVVRWSQHTRSTGPGGGKIKRQYVRDDPDAPMQFISANFEAMLTGLKANSSGHWIMTLQIAPEEGQAIFPMHMAFGLALDMHVQRRRFKPDDST